MILRSVYTLTFLCLTVASVYAQKEVDTQANSWFMYFGNHRISDKIGLHTEYQWRRHELGETWQQSLMRLGLDYHTTSGAMITAGYGWIRSFPYGEQPIAYPFNEHRIWQQLILKQKSGRLSFQHRYRLEQRFLQRKQLDALQSYQDDGYVFRQRVRYRFLASLPLNQEKMGEGALFIAAYAEPFIGFGKGIGVNILDQNRLYGALGYQASSKFQIQAGYLNQMIFKSDGIRVERNHNLQIGVTYNMDFRNTDSSD